MNKYVITILSALCLCGCNRIIDYEYTTILTIKNNCAHTVAIKGSSGIYTLECLINPGESYSGKGNEEIPWIPEFFTGSNCSVIFDSKLAVDHGEIQEHSICRAESYTVKTSGRHKTKSEYTYIFTDEDYERAVAAMQAAESNTIQRP